MPGLQPDGRIAACELAERLEGVLPVKRLAHASRTSSAPTRLRSLRNHCGSTPARSSEMRPRAPRTRRPMISKEIARIVAILLEGLYYPEDETLRLGIAETLRFGIAETLPNTVAFARIWLMAPLILVPTS